MSRITTGIVHGAWSVLIYGPGGIGKSTWASEAPGPLFIQCGEVGSLNLNVARTPLEQKWEEALADVEAVISGKGVVDGYRVGTLIIDTLDGLEKLGWDYLCRTKKTVKGEVARDIEDFDFQAGYKAVLTPWRSLLSRLEVVLSMGINVVFVAHERVQKYSNPNGSDYDRYAPDVHKDLVALIKNWVHCVFFAYEEVSVTKKAGSQKLKAVSSGVRMVHTVEKAAYLAKNRYSLPDPLELSFSAFAECLPSAKGARSTEKIAELKACIVEEAGDDTKLAEDALKWAGDSERRLESALNKVRAKMADKARDAEQKEEGQS